MFKQTKKRQKLCEIEKMIKRILIEKKNMIDWMISELLCCQVLFLFPKLKMRKCEKERERERKIHRNTLMIDLNEKQMNENAI